MNLKNCIQFVKYTGGSVRELKNASIWDVDSRVCLKRVILILIVIVFKLFLNYNKFVLCVFGLYIPCFLFLGFAT